MNKLTGSASVGCEEFYCRKEGDERKRRERKCGRLFFYMYYHKEVTREFWFQHRVDINIR
jgi:hypothetical protein